jgi:tRNA-intron endonuclease, archaea type
MSGKPVITVVYHDSITLPVSDESATLAQQGYGTRLASGKVKLSSLEAVHLHAIGKLVITNERGTPLTEQALERKAAKHDKRFSTRLAVFSDLRNRGYAVKTGLKFGAEFVVYERGTKPGEDHSRWVVYPVHEREHFGWHDFSAKNRVAHTTQKRLMIAVVDDDGDVIYYETRWMRP